MTLSVKLTTLTLVFNIFPVGLKIFLVLLVILKYLLLLVLMPRFKHNNTLDPLDMPPFSRPLMLLQSRFLYNHLARRLLQLLQVLPLLPQFPPLVLQLISPGVLMFNSIVRFPLLRRSRRDLRINLKLIVPSFLSCIHSIVISVELKTFTFKYSSSSVMNRIY